MTVNIAIQITNDDGETSTVSFTNQPSVAEAIAYTLRALADYIPRMDQVMADAIVLVSEQIIDSYHEYNFFPNHAELRNTLVNTADKIAEGWEGHDAGVSV
jgi:hypothetical protein